jgi:hypothetical protein
MHVGRQAVIDAAAGAPVAFTELGLVKLKGVAGSMPSYEAFRPD